MSRRPFETRLGHNLRKGGLLVGLGASVIMAAGIKLHRNALEEGTACYSDGGGQIQCVAYHKNEQLAAVELDVAMVAGSVAILGAAAAATARTADKKMYHRQVVSTEMTKLEEQLLVPFRELEDSLPPPRIENIDI